MENPTQPATQDVTGCARRSRAQRLPTLPRTALPVMLRNALPAMLRTALPVTLCAALLAACGPGPTDPPPVSLPPTTGVLDYQLGGTYEHLGTAEQPLRIDVVARDATATPLQGAYNICYVNGFQTQPDDDAYWLENQAALLRDNGGQRVVDPAWPDEFVLDPSTPAQRDLILDHLGPVIDGCASAGFDAVEIDNFDTWTRFDAIDRAGAFALATSYVDRAHRAGLAIAQKNGAEVAVQGQREIGFDFAVAESCAAWDECAAYSAAYGDHVLAIEYPQELTDAGLTFDDACALDGRPPLTILRDRNLVGAAQPGYTYAAC